MRFKKIGTHEGLLTKTVRAFLRDQQGFLWVGTAGGGLYRYDGYSFTSFTHDPQDSTSLFTDHVWDIKQDTLQQIWIANGGGLSKYLPQTESFQTFSFQGIDEGCTELLISKDNRIWMGINNSEGGLVEFDPQTELYQRHLSVDGKAFGQVFALLENTDGTLWVAAKRGLCLYHPDRKQLLDYFPYRDPEQPFASDYITSLIKDRQGQLWLGSQEGYTNVHPDTRKVERKRIPLGVLSEPNGNAIEDIFQDSKGDFWFCTSGGLYLYQPGADRWMGYAYKEEDPTSISSTAQRVVYEDRQGILWIGTHKGGVSYIDPQLNRFCYYENYPFHPTSLSNDQVTCFYEDRQKRLWVGTDGGGLNLFDPSTGSFKNYMNHPDEQGDFCTNVILSIMEDKKGKLWLASYGGGLIYFDPDTEKFQCFKNDPQDSTSLFDNFLSVGLMDHRGRIWTGTFKKGLGVFDPDTHQFQAFPISKDSLGIASPTIYDMVSDSYNRIWIADFCLSMYDVHTQSFTHYFYEEFQKNGLRSYTLNCVFEDKDLQLWVGTDKGLQLLNEEQGSFEFYGEEQGLLSVEVQSIQQDHNGLLWLGTKQGLSAFDPVKKELVENYVMDVGHKGNDFNRHASFRTSDHHLLFGSDRGFVYFHPDSLLKNQAPPQLSFTGLKIFNESVSFIERKKVLTEHISTAEEIYLCHEQSTISIEYVALNLLSPAENQYAYMLEGLDTDWTYVKNERKATYTNLPPGEYVFRLKAANNDGVWNMEGISIKIHVSAPFWKAWWFIALLTVSVAVVLYGIYRARVRILMKHKLKLEREVALRIREIATQKKKIEEYNTHLLEKNEQISLKNAQLGDLNQLKNKIFSIISHDFRSPLNALLVTFHLLESNKLNKNELQLLSKELKERVRLTSELLDNLLYWAKSQMEGVVLSPKSIDLGNFVNHNFVLLLQKAEAKEITVNIHIPDPIQVMADEDILKIVFRNLLSNAIKFSEWKGEVTVGAREQGGKVTVWVEDQGPGVPEEVKASLFSLSVKPKSNPQKEKGIGLGLMLCREFIELHGERIWLDEKREKGSLFAFTLSPANKALIPDKMYSLQNS
ncbi:two-component regulator propeller domain-containing protein [Rapidithrix thailandica]|uniref:histidine kinase n=1 Tax=Rapidithrix thailandica TaxID=413964 RepID=A0AAW9SAQ8_9BACT